LPCNSLDEKYAKSGLYQNKVENFFLDDFDFGEL